LADASRAHRDGLRASGAVAKFKREFDKLRQKLLIEMEDRGTATVCRRFEAYPAR
jgi:hypothetical protein